MAANVNQPDNTPNVTNAGSLADQPNSAGHDGTGDGVNLDPTGSASKPLPRAPSTGGPTTDTNSNVVSRPNPAATFNTTLRPGRSPVQLASSRPMSSLERQSTGPGLIVHDPIRGDIPHRHVHTSDVGVEEDVPDIMGRQWSRNGVGRVHVSRPRSVMSPTERTVVADEHMSGPGSTRGSRLVSPGFETPPVRIFIRGWDLGDLNAHLAEREDSPGQAAADYRCRYDRERQVPKSRCASDRPLLRRLRSHFSRVLMTMLV